MPSGIRNAARPNRYRRSILWGLRKTPWREAKLFRAEPSISRLLSQLLPDPVQNPSHIFLGRSCQRCYLVRNNSFVPKVQMPWKGWPWMVRRRVDAVDLLLNLPVEGVLLVRRIPHIQEGPIPQREAKPCSHQLGRLGKYVSKLVSRNLSEAQKPVSNQAQRRRGQARNS